MKGLEISEVELSEVVSMAATFRYDPEYFQKVHLTDFHLAKAESTRFVSFAELGITVDGSAFYPSIEDYYDAGDLPFLRVADVDAVIDFQKCTTIPSELCDRFDTLKKVHAGDIVLTKGGSVARVGFVRQAAAVSRDLIFLNTSNLPTEEQSFLYLYFSTSFFNRMLLRSSSQTAQPHLTLTLVRELPLFIASDTLKKKCAEMVAAGFTYCDESVAGFLSAEQTLLRALGLENWKPPEPLTYTRRAADVFAAGRFDAEMLQPRYDALRAKLEKVAGLRAIDDFGEVVRSDFVPTADRIYQYTEISDVNAGSGDVGWNSVASEELPANAKIRLSGGELLVSKVRPTRGAVGINYDTTLKDHVCSGAFLVLRVASPRREFLQVFLRSKAGKLLLEERCKGSSYPTLDDEDIRAVVAPEVDKELMNTIKTAAENAHNARRRAHALLERSKRAVEVAIEESESAALKLLAEPLEA